jgi:hypothetical protein
MSRAWRLAVRHSQLASETPSACSGGRRLPMTARDRRQQWPGRSVRPAVEPVIERAEAHIGGGEDARDGEALGIHGAPALDLLARRRAMGVGLDVIGKRHGEIQK